jgi:uncharacterized protein (TIGR03435 family)
MRRCIYGLVTIAIWAQSPTFEVASIKPHLQTPGPFRVSTSVEIGRIDYTNVTLRNCILQAYGVKGYQLTGGPNWIATDRFDVSAKATGPAGKLEMMTMLQGLLVERFQLAFHRESKEIPVYFLTVSKGGPTLHAAKDDGRGTEIGAGSGPGTAFHNATMAALAGVLSGLRDLQYPVFDRTGLKGAYNFTLDLEANGDAPDNPAYHDIFAALQGQLGLKLEPGKGAVEMFVIERAERPSGN